LGREKILFLNQGLVDSWVKWGAGSGSARKDRRVWRGGGKGSENKLTGKNSYTMFIQQRAKKGRKLGRVLRLKRREGSRRVKLKRGKSPKHCWGRKELGCDGKGKGGQHRPGNCRFGRRLTGRVLASQLWEKMGYKAWRQLRWRTGRGRRRNPDSPVQKSVGLGVVWGEGQPVVNRGGRGKEVVETGPFRHCGKKESGS